MASLVIDSKPYPIEDARAVMSSSPLLQEITKTTTNGIGLSTVIQRAWDDVRKGKPLDFALLVRSLKEKAPVDGLPQRVYDRFTREEERFNCDAMLLSQKP